MVLNCGFEPLFDRLIYIRHLAFVRPAIPEYVDPLLCLYSFYFTLDQNGQVIYATDQKPEYQPKVAGKFRCMELYHISTEFCVHTHLTYS